jgi:2-iminobutanoate/2-iminopropanoate deaminase
MHEIRTDGAPSSPSPISQGIRAGDYVFVSGQTPRRPDGETVQGDFESEVRCVLDNVRAIVEASGAELTAVCKVNAYITDAALFDDFNRIYREYFSSKPVPARTTVCTALARPEIRVEIEAIVYVGVG